MLTSQPIIAIDVGDVSALCEAPRANENVTAEAAPLGEKLIVGAAIVLPLLGFVASIVLLWDYGFSWLYLGLLAGMYHLSALGVTLGYHRLFTHRAFETTRPVRLALGIFGSMAVQGPLLKWVANHRRHHQYSDMPGDPHSPHLQGKGIRAALRGLWHSHIGWLFEPDAPGLYRYVSDLSADRLIRGVSKLFPLWVLLGLVIPTLLGGILSGTWMGALLGFLWGGLARVFLLHHVTWSINSACHIWGRQAFRTRDRSRNNVVFGILGMGEGWHNNHHAFPTSARHGLAWWQFDLSYLIIRSLQRLKLAWRVRLPGDEVLAAKLRQA